MSKDYQIVETNYGKVKGLKVISDLKTPYNAFFGIPYAKPPIGELRFRSPILPEPWNETFDATEEKPGCFEKNSILKKIIGTEDCLRLNIYTKNVRPKKLQPVMVYIFGGGFNSGCAWLKAYSPDYLLMSDVVVVVMNYRLGAFGFLSLDDKDLNVPGNAGLKDQHMAMKFVKENIEKFGGDSENITLFGHSSGAHCVSWHCMNQMSKGLFHRAILLSGSTLSKAALAPRMDWAYRLATKIGYDGSKEDKKVFKFLQTADPEQIVEFQKSLIISEETAKIHFAFAPSIERYVSDDTLIWGNEVEMFRGSWSHDIDIIIGGTNDEGLGFLPDIRDNPNFSQTFKLESFIPIDDLDPKDPRAIEFVDDLRKVFYTQTVERDSIGLTKEERAYCNMKGAGMFWFAMHRMIRGRQNSGGKGKTFIYRFGVDSPTQNHYRIRHFGPEQRGVPHADEICYFFKNMFSDVPAENSMEFIAIKRFTSLLTSFATTGNPNDNILNADLQNVRWEAVDTSMPPFKGLSIEEDLKFDIVIETERLMVWDRLYEATNTDLY